MSNYNVKTRGVAARPRSQRLREIGGTADSQSKMMATSSGSGASAGIDAMLRDLFNRLFVVHYVQEEQVDTDGNTVMVDTDEIESLESLFDFWTQHAMSAGGYATGEIGPIVVLPATDIEGVTAEDITKVASAWAMKEWVRTHQGGGGSGVTVKSFAEAINLQTEDLTIVPSAFAVAQLFALRTTVDIFTGGAQLHIQVYDPQTGSIGQQNIYVPNETSSILYLIGNNPVNRANADANGNTISSTYATKTELSNGLGNKVDKVSGKGLSTNDYTTNEKSKLAGIAAGAEVNVQSDWTENDSSKDSYIKNKPTIPTATQSDWNVTDTTSPAYIKNKPQNLINQNALNSWEGSENLHTSAHGEIIGTGNIGNQTVAAAGKLTNPLNIYGHEVDGSTGKRDITNTITLTNNGYTCTITLDASGNLQISNGSRTINFGSGNVVTSGQVTAGA